MLVCGKNYLSSSAARCCLTNTVGNIGPKHAAERPESRPHPNTPISGPTSKKDLLHVPQKREQLEVLILTKLRTRNYHRKVTNRKLSNKLETYTISFEAQRNWDNTKLSKKTTRNWKIQNYQRKLDNRTIIENWTTENYQRKPNNLKLSQETEQLETTRENWTTRN